MTAVSHRICSFVLVDSEHRLMERRVQTSAYRINGESLSKEDNLLCKTLWLSARRHFVPETNSAEIIYVINLFAFMLRHSGMSMQSDQAIGDTPGR